MEEQAKPETQIAAGQSTAAGYPPKPPGGSQLPPEAAPPGRPRRRGSWAIAVVIILVGIVFLIRNTGWLGSDWDFDNWWALFILIPAFGSFADAWSSYVSSSRRFGAKAARSFSFGLLFLTIAVIFLLKLDWSNVWPVLLIIVGVGMVLGWRRD